MYSNRKGKPTSVTGVCPKNSMTEFYLSYNEW